ncbi:MAG: hypothetical protein ACYS6W_13675, partial [Planctomycetota bacterium]
MQNQNLKFKIINLGLCLLVFGLCGCAIVEYFKPEGPPYDEELSQRYNRTKLKESSSADVLTAIHMPEYELLSQSTSVIASSGQKKKGHKIWFNMVAFDENELTAKRKYLSIVDDRPNILEEPRKYFSFDCEKVLESEVLEEPYANENTRRIAILKQVLANVRKDIGEVSSDNKMLAVSGMLINQALETVLVKLDSSPVLATKLSEPGGVDFSHINLGRGKIQMLVEDDIVTVKMRLGSL